ncbi:MAG: tripartite tricarboxylate transporter substrate-binding protein, partial [Alphaproteobacteria bacterium]
LALNRMVAAKPDGLTLMIVNGPAAAVGQLLGKEGVRYDLGEVVWLGRVTSEERVLLWSANSPFRSLADGLKAPRTIKWGADDKAGSLAFSAAFASEALGLDSLIITGYKGSKEAALAAIRGEADGMAVSASSAKKYAQGGKMIPVVVLARERSPLFPDVQTIFEEVSLSEDAAWWIDYHSRLLQIGRAMATTPGVPEERVAFLRRAFEEILTDPGVVAEGEKIGRVIRYATAERSGELVAETLSTLGEERLARVRSVVLEKYY